MSSKKKEKLKRFAWIGSLAAIALFFAGDQLYGNIMTTGQRTIALASLIFLFISITILLHVKPLSTKIESSKYVSKYFLLAMILLLIIFCCVTLLEVTHFGHRWILSLLLFSLGLIIMSVQNMYKLEVRNIYIVLVFFLSFFALTYTIFPPSLGNDTWRDIFYASEIKNNGHIISKNPAYPVPVSSILYAFVSSVQGIDMTWASVLIGFTYLSLITLLPYVAYSKIFGIEEGTILSSVFSLLNCMVILWVPCFIPQAYSIALVLCILLLELNLTRHVYLKRENMVLITILSISVVIGHGGVAICFIVFLSIKWMISAFNRHFLSQRVSGAILVIFSMITFIYWGLTTVLEYCVNFAQSIIKVISALITGNIRPIQTTALQSPWYSYIFSYAALYIIPILAFVAWLEYVPHRDAKNKIIVETIFFTSTMLLILAFIGNLFGTHLALDRYLGVVSYSMLAILAGVGASMLLKKGRIGKYFVTFSLILLALGFTLGGSFTPDYKPLGYSEYSLVANPTYGEQKVIQTLLPILCSKHVLVDWRLGLPLTYTMVVLHSADSSQNIYLGYSGLTASIEDILLHIKQGGIFIYREVAFKQMNLRAGNYTLEELRRALENTCNKIYSSTNGIEVYGK